MEFAFPPAPLDYSVVIVARCLLVAWSLIGLCIVAVRLRRLEVGPAGAQILWWAAAAAISCVVAFFGICKYPIYDNNDWNIPSFLAAASVSIAGITVCLYKVATEGTQHEKRTWIGGTVGTGIAIWLVLFLNFWSSMRNSPEAYHRNECRYHLKDIGRAMHNYLDERDTFPPPASGAPLVSWRVTLLPYMDENTVYSRYDRKAEWNQAPNLVLARQRIRVLSCPSSYPYQGDDEMYDTAYSMLTGPQTVGGNPGGTRLGDIKDGASNTAMVVEACGAQINWSEPRDVNIADQPAAINMKGHRPGHSKGWMSSCHFRGAHILQADGAVRFVSSETDPGVLQNLAKIDDAPVPDEL